MWSWIWDLVTGTLLDPAWQVQQSVMVMSMVLDTPAWLPIPGYTDVMGDIRDWAMGPAIPAAYKILYFFASVAMPIEYFKIGLSVFQLGFVVTSLVKLVMLLKAHFWVTPTA